MMAQRISFFFSFLFFFHNYCILALCVDTLSKQVLEPMLSEIEAYIKHDKHQGVPTVYTYVKQTVTKPMPIFFEIKYKVPSVVVMECENEMEFFPHHDSLTINGIE